MDKNYRLVTIEDELWRRYDECYTCAKLAQDAHTMMEATDRMAALMGVTFEIPDDEEDDE